MIEPRVSLTKAKAVFASLLSRCAKGVSALTVVTVVGMGVPASAQTQCTNLCLQQVSCPANGTTSISGTVYAPNGVDPLPNVLVYIPNAPVAAFTPGVQCLQSGQPASGSPLVSATTAIDGTFTLKNVPAGSNIPLVIQTGTWRRQFVIPTVAACGNTLASTSVQGQIRFPRTQSEGDIPLTALVTGSADNLECVLRKVGIADSEFTNPSGTGRIQIYTGLAGPGSQINAATPNETVLESSPSVIDKYDLLMLACQGATYSPSSSALTNMASYLNAGGRVFATHYSYDFLVGNGTLNNVAQWSPQQSSPPDQQATVNTSFPKGLQLAQWLQLVGASTTFGKVQVNDIRRDQNGVIPPTQSFLNISVPTESIQFTFNTPVGAPVASQCGRVLFNEYHVESVSGATGTFPTECTNGAMTPQEKLLEYSLFDLSTFVSPDIPPTIGVTFTNTPTPFTQGDSADTVVIAVANSSTTTATNPSLSVSLTLPVGLTAVSLAPQTPGTSGWSCNVGSLTCTRTTGLNASASDSIVLTVAVASNAPSLELLNVTVAGGGQAVSTTVTDSIPVLLVPTITWPTPAPIMSGTALSGTQLDATASYGGTPVAGTFVYTPAAGTVLAPGSQPLSVVFTPADPATYASATGSTSVQVNQGTPTISWLTPAPITYGTPLSGTQLNATATYNGSTVAGTFQYMPASGTVLGVGVRTLNVLFTPTDTAGYTTATASVTINVTAVTPTITWATPAPITYGTALSGTQLNATASVPGTFVYTPAAGAVLAVGSRTLSVTFTPTDATDYTTATATVTLSVTAVTPTITWATPAPIAYGTALSGTQLNATASVPGTFVYSPAAGAVLAVGSRTLSVTFTPTDATDYTTATATVTLSVTAVTPTITWAMPAPIAYGTALSGTQLNATASVPGTFVYSPAAGAVLAVGSRTLSVTFTPTDATDYTTATATVTLSVTAVTPTITWATPAPIAYGTALSGTQLNATASVPGTFVYSPAAGAVLAVGSRTLSVTFTPTDATDYTTATATVTLSVTAVTPTITWATPAPIAYGTALSGTQLNATASVPGTFVYSPAAGAVLAVGSRTLSVTFTPTDATDYTTATATVTLSVTAVTPTITWATPAPIAYGTALSGTQLNATASVPGTFVYSPAAGAVLAVGSRTLSVTFTPTDATDYTTATATVTLNVTAVTPTITWATPAPITYGTALSGTQLNATSTVAGSFAYAPVAGTVPAAGTQTLTVTLTPTDATDYRTATAAVALTVNKASTTTAITVTTTQTVNGTTATITATVKPQIAGSPSGTVTYYSGTTVLGTAPVGTAFVSGVLPVGANVLSAVYGGDANFLASSSAKTTVTSVLPTTIYFNLAVHVSVYPLAVVYDVIIPTRFLQFITGTYTIYDGNTPIITQPVLPLGIEAGLTLPKLAPGVHNLYAVYNGDANYPAGRSPVQVLTVLPSPLSH